jgi:hypothetical protein
MKIPNYDLSYLGSSGEGGIRTLGTLACTPVFETGPIGRSGTSPVDTTAYPIESYGIQSTVPRLCRRC